MNELQSLPNKFVRNVEEEMVEDSANVIFGDNISTPSLPKLSKKNAQHHFMTGNQKNVSALSPLLQQKSLPTTGRWHLRWQVQLYLLFWMHFRNGCQTLGQSNLCPPPPVKQDPLKIQYKGLNETQSLFEGISVIHLNTRSKKETSRWNGCFNVFSWIPKSSDILIENPVDKIDDDNLFCKQLQDIVKLLWSVLWE